MGRPLVLDTSALLAGRPLGPTEDTVIPQAVLNELRPGGRDRRHLDNLLAAGARTSDADPQTRKRVQEEARKGGEDTRLSANDIDILTVALQLDAELATDDYTIQNLAHRLNIPTRNIQTVGISGQYRFTTRCTGCRRTYDTPPPKNECPTCGSPTRSVKAR